MNKKKSIEVLCLIGLDFSITGKHCVDKDEWEKAKRYMEGCEAIKFAIEFMEEHDG